MLYEVITGAQSKTSIERGIRIDRPHKTIVETAGVRTTLAGNILFTGVVRTISISE